MTVLITGVAGFIGYHLAQRLLELGMTVHGIDNLNNYYDVQLKRDRLAQLLPNAGFHFHPMDLGDRHQLPALFETHHFDSVINLAAQAGVRYSIENPWAYIDSNIHGFMNLLECCRAYPPHHLVYASSSSVYGANTKVPFATTALTDHPVSLYAATKKANELMARTYSHLYGIPATGLRFFTVYGPWGRPDMAYFKFVRAIATGQPIDVYNFGQMERDFTYIDDIVEGLLRVMANPPTTESVPHKVYNLGNHSPVSLMTFIETIEAALGKTARKNFLPMQPGDVLTTYADVDDLIADVGFRPDTPLDVGIAQFVQWYQAYYGVEQSVPVSYPSRPAPQKEHQTEYQTEYQNEHVAPSLSPLDRASRRPLALPLRPSR